MQTPHQQPMYKPRHQQGVALITALLIVALATIISVSISTQLQLDVRRTGNILASEQATLYAPTAEYLARRILRDDRLDNNIDHNEEVWANELATDVNGGTITGRLHDLQACFNLNSLYAGGAPVPLAEDRFRRLLANLPTTSSTTTRITPGTIVASIIDWIDEDLRGSAEDVYYMNLEKPYRPANAAIQSISELRVIRGFEQKETFDALINNDRLDSELKYFVCAFGVKPNININVNTAPAEVLESLAAGINAADIINERESRPFDNINDFITRNSLGTIIPAPNRIGLSVSTNYFLLKTIANIGQARTLMYSIIQREANGDTSIIARSQGAYL